MLIGLSTAAWAGPYDHAVEVAVAAAAASRPAPPGLPSALADAPLGGRGRRAELRRCARGKVDGCRAAAVAADRAWAWSVARAAAGRSEPAVWRAQQATALWAAACALGDEDACRTAVGRDPWVYGDLLDCAPTCTEGPLSLTSWGWISDQGYLGRPLPDPGHGVVLHQAVGDRLVVVFADEGAPVRVVVAGPDPAGDQRFEFPPLPAGHAPYLRSGTLLATGRDDHLQIVLRPGATWEPAGPPTAIAWPDGVGDPVAASPDGTRFGFLDGSALRVTDAEGTLLAVHGPMRRQGAGSHGGSVPMPIALSRGAVATGGCVHWVDGGSPVDRPPPFPDLPATPRDVALTGEVGGSARVVVRTAAGEVREAQADEAGRFEVTGLPRSAWIDVTATAPGRILHTRLVRPAGPTAVVWPEVVEVQLLDHGVPAAGVEVATEFGRAPADGAGRIRLPRDLRAWVGAVGWVGGGGPREVGRPPDVLQATDCGGRPLAGVTVEAPTALGPVPLGETDAQGMLTLDRPFRRDLRLSRRGEALEVTSSGPGPVLRIGCRVEPVTAPDIPAALRPSDPYWADPTVWRSLEEVDGELWWTEIDVRGDGPAEWRVERVPTIRVRLVDGRGLPTPGVTVTRREPHVPTWVDRRADLDGWLDVPRLEGWAVQVAGTDVPESWLGDGGLRVVPVDASSRRGSWADQVRERIPAPAGAVDLRPAEALPEERLPDAVGRALVAATARWGTPYAPGPPVDDEALLDAIWAARPLPVVRVAANGRAVTLAVPAGAGAPAEPPPPDPGLARVPAGRWAALGDALREADAAALEALDPIVLAPDLVVTRRGGPAAWAPAR